MTDTPQLLLAHHLKALKLPTFLREYEKLARQCVSTPEQNCIVFRSKNASIMPTRMASSMGSFRGRQAWVGSSDDGSALLRRERRLL